MWLLLVGLKLILLKIRFCWNGWLVGLRLVVLVGGSRLVVLVIVLFGVMVIGRLKCLVLQVMKKCVLFWMIGLFRVKLYFFLVEIIFFLLFWCLVGVLVCMFLLVQWQNVLFLNLLVLDLVVVVIVVFDIWLYLVLQLLLMILYLLMVSCGNGLLVLLDWLVMLLFLMQFFWFMLLMQMLVLFVLVVLLCSEVLFLVLWVKIRFGIVLVNFRKLCDICGVVWICCRLMVLLILEVCIFCSRVGVIMLMVFRLVVVVEFGVLLVVLVKFSVVVDVMVMVIFWVWLLVIMLYVFGFRFISEQLLLVWMVLWWMVLVVILVVVILVLVWVLVIWLCRLVLVDCVMMLGVVVSIRQLIRVVFSSWCVGMWKVVCIINLIFGWW